MRRPAIAASAWRQRSKCELNSNFSALTVWKSAFLPYITRR